MKFVLTDLDSLGAPVISPITLGDDTNGDLIIDPMPNPVEQRQVQIEPLAFGNRVFAKGRGNRHLTWSWTVQRQHADKATALTFWNSHAATVPLNASIAWTNDGGPNNFSSAAVSEVSPIALTGISTTFRYTVTGAVPA